MLPHEFEELVRSAQGRKKYLIKEAHQAVDDAVTILTESKEKILSFPVDYLDEGDVGFYINHGNLALLGLKISEGVHALSILAEFMQLFPLCSLTRNSRPPVFESSWLKYFKYLTECSWYKEIILKLKEETPHLLTPQTFELLTKKWGHLGSPLAKNRDILLLKLIQSEQPNLQCAEIFESVLSSQTGCFNTDEMISTTFVDPFFSKLSIDKLISLSEEFPLLSGGTLFTLYSSMGNAGFFRVLRVLDFTQSLEEQIKGFKLTQREMTAICEISHRTFFQGSNLIETLVRECVSKESIEGETPPLILLVSDMISKQTNFLYRRQETGSRHWQCTPEILEYLCQSDDPNKRLTELSELYAVDPALVESKIQELIPPQDQKPQHTQLSRSSFFPLGSHKKTLLNIITERVNEKIKEFQERDEKEIKKCLVNLNKLLSSKKRDKTLLNQDQIGLLCCSGLVTVHSHLDDKINCATGYIFNDVLRAISFCPLTERGRFLNGLIECPESMLSLLECELPERAQEPIPTR